MATVAIIHAAEDTLPARALAEKLRQAKLTVLLEKPPGEDLRNAIKGAQVTIALWSPRAIAQPALAEDVAYARGKSKVIHALMQNAAVPEAFRGDKSVNLTGWRGEDDFQAWRDLAKAVTDKAGVAPMPPPAPRMASGFFQPGALNPAAVAAAEKRGPAPGTPMAGPRLRPQPAAAQPSRPAQGSRPAPRQAPPPPPRSAPRYDDAPAAEKSGGGGRGMLIAVAAFVVIAAVGGGGYYFWSQTQTAHTTSIAWDSIDRTSAASIRAFIANDPGDHRADAERALAELEERSFEAASDSDTIDALEGFLNDFPESTHALAARGRIAELRTLTPTPASATDSTTAPSTTSTTDPDLLPPGAAPSTTPAPDASSQTTSSSAPPADLTPPAPAPSTTP